MSTKGNREKKITDLQVVTAYRLNSGDLEATASELRISLNSMYRWRKGSPELEAALKEASQSLRDSFEEEILEAYRRSEGSLKEACRELNISKRVMGRLRRDSPHLTERLHQEKARMRVSDEEIARAYVQSGGNFEQTAKRIGISQPTLLEWRKASPRLQELLNQARESLRQSYREQIVQTFHRNRGEIKSTAKELNIHSYTLQRWKKRSPRLEELMARTKATFEVTDEKIVEAYRLHRTDLPATAAELQISVSTLFYRRKNSPELVERLRQVDDSFRDYAESQEMSLIRDGNVKVIKSYLKRKAKSRGYTLKSTNPGIPTSQKQARELMAMIEQGSDENKTDENQP